MAYEAKMTFSGKLDGMILGNPAGFGVAALAVANTEKPCEARGKMEYISSGMMVDSL